MESYIVLGGSGFLGRNLVKGLKGRGEKNVSTFDMVQRYDDVPHFTGDVTSVDDLCNAFKKSGATTIFHTVSPAPEAPAAVHHKVNILGTQAVIKAAQLCKIRMLVYTSSGSIADDGRKVIDADERVELEKWPDAYNETKAKAEREVLAANGEEGLLTCSIRPLAIYGPGDSNTTPGLAKVILEGKTHFQIGDNNNIFDFTYIDNIVHAHILAADGLKRCVGLPSEKWPIDKNDLYTPLEFSSLSTGYHRIPTSECKPQGPTIGPTYESEEAEKRFRDTKTVEFRPVTRTKFDQFTEASLDIEPKEILQVPGQAFFISNGEPIYFWDFSRAMWKEMGHIAEKKTFVLPRTVGYYFGLLSETISWITGKRGAFDTYRARIVSNPRWYNIERARRVLGYEPIVGHEEGIRRAVEWWNTEGKNALKA